MRPIPAAIETLLKGRKMIGADRPAYEVTVAGQPDELNVLAAVEGGTWRRPDSTSAGGLSFAERADGNIIVVWDGTDRFVEGYVADVSTLLGGDNTVTGKQDILIDADVEWGSATVFNDPSGDLYLHTARRHYDGTTRWQEVKIYKSPSGNGGDWTLHGTVRDTSLNFGYTQNVPTGKPYFTTAGRWILPTVYYVEQAGVAAAPPAIMYSDDGGVTFNDANPSFAFSGAYARYCYWNVRAITFYDGKYWWGGGHTWGTNGAQWVYSSTDGATWTYEYDLISHANISALWRWCFIADDSYMYMPGNQTGVLAKLLKTDNPATINDWDLIWDDDLGTIENRDTFITYIEGENYWLLQILHHVVGILAEKELLPVKSISISRSPGMAAELSLLIDNKDGVYSPDPDGRWKHILFPNNEITVKQGYGTELEQTFIGPLDRIAMDNTPTGGAEMAITCRDRLKRAFDQTITNASGGHTITYTDEAVEDIFTDLATKAGYTEITTEATGIILVEKTFSNESYGDAFSWLAELVNFEFRCDEDGRLFFVYATDRQPESSGLKFTLNATTAVDITGTTDDDAVATGKAPIVEDSEIVTNLAGTTTYIKDTDYTITYGSSTAEATLVRITGGGIGDGEQVLISYVYAAWIFKEGQDIARLSYVIDDKKLYYEVKVSGKDSAGDVIEATAPYTARDLFNVLPQKVLRMEALNADTVPKCQEIADRTAYLIRSKSREVTFGAVGTPYIQVGDCVQVIESSSSISEIYRITDLNSQQTSGSDGRYFCVFTAHYYGFAPTGV